MNLEDYIYKECLTYGDYTLSSGKKSDKYFDLRKLTLDYVMMDVVRQELDMLLYKNGILHAFESIGGLETGAIPIITLMVYYRCKPGFYVRKSKKQHGMQNQIEGKFYAPYIIVDDVATTGGSMLRVEEVLQLKPIGRLCIIDRRCENRDPEILSLFKESDFT